MIALLFSSLFLLCLTSQATNLSLGKSYKCLQAPASKSSVADHSGPEPFKPGTFYRGELTDGKRGSGTELVSWQIRYQPIPIEIDLEKEEVVGAIDLSPEVVARDGSRQAPYRIDVSVRSPRFSPQTWIQIAQWKVAEKGTEPAPIHIDLPPVKTAQIRLAFIGKPWDGLQLDEIAVLSTTKPPISFLSLQDVNLEAEDYGGEIVADKAASGRAVELKKSSKPLEFSLPLPAAIYTLRIRSRALKQDVFGELLPSVDDTNLRPQPVTNGVFTWQRSHFVQKKAGEAKLRFQVTEGDGILIDQIRIHRCDLNEPIAKVKDFARESDLRQALIVYGDKGQFRETAEKLAADIEQRCGVRLPLRAAEDITELDLRGTNLLALGSRETNVAMLKARPSAYEVIPVPAKDGGAKIGTAVEIRGTGTNLIFLTGGDEAQVAASCQKLLDYLPADAAEKLPWIQFPPSQNDRDAYRKWAVASGKWLRQGGIRTILKHSKYYDDACFNMLLHRYWEYLDSADTIRRAHYSGSLDMEFHKILPTFEAREHNHTISPADHLALTNLMARLSDLTTSLFVKWWGLRGDGGEAGLTERIRNRPPKITWNHQTFPTLCLYKSADYFGKNYDLKSAHQRKEWAERLMQAPLISSKPLCDCSGYQEITMAHVAYFAAASRQRSFFEGAPLYNFLKLNYLSYDNLNSMVGYGDVGGYRAPLDGDARENHHALKNITGNRMDFHRLSPEDIEGLYVHPLEPLWHNVFGKNSPVPLGKSFDKLTMRQSHDPNHAYLLLDGASGGTHGHWDGNSILRFTDNGRMWLCEGDYLKGDVKEHNTLTIMRDGESELPEKIVELRLAFTAGDWALTITRTPNCRGADWDRKLLWHRPSDTFFMIDSLTALQPGTFDTTAHFRSLGETRLENRIWRVEQQGGERFYLHAPGIGKLSTATVPEDAKNWKRYEYANPTPQLFQHRRIATLATGETVDIPNVFYAAGTGAEPRLKVTTRADGLVASGKLAATILSRAHCRENLRIQAEYSLLSQSSALFFELSEVAADGLRLSSRKPVTVAFDFATNTAKLIAGEKGFLTIQINQKKQRFRFEAGENNLAKLPAELGKTLGALHSQLSSESNSSQNRKQQDSRPADLNTRILATTDLPASGNCLQLARLDNASEPDCVVGCADGTLLAVAADGSERWRVRLPARINALAAGDFDGDARDEIVCAVEDSHLYLLDNDGTQLWKKFFDAYRAAGGGEGHPRAVLVADFETDGKLDIAIGCANSYFYVLNGDGSIKTSATGEEWKTVIKQKACSLAAAEMTGDKLLELICGYTYTGRQIVDFSRSGYDRLSGFGGCTSGARATAAGDFDGDGRAEALFADADGRITVTKTYKKKRGTADILWQKYVGNEMHRKAIVADIVGDSFPELFLASANGFVALLDANGEMLWIRYTTAALSDAALLAGKKRAPLLLGGTVDGSLTVFDGQGKIKAHWNAKSAIRGVAVRRLAEQDLAWAIEDGRLTKLGIR